MPTSIPNFVQKYFWGDDLTELSWKSHKKYISQTIMEKGDLDAISWLLGTSPFSELKKTLDSSRLSKRSRRFWELYLS